MGVEPALTISDAAVANNLFYPPYRSISFQFNVSLFYLRGGETLKEITSIYWFIVKWPQQPALGQAKVKSLELNVGLPHKWQGVH